MADHHPDSSQAGHDHAGHTAYGRLAAMTILSFLAMYALMYAMVDKAANIHPSLNQAYMAGLMTAPAGPLQETGNPFRRTHLDYGFHWPEIDAQVQTGRTYNSFQLAAVQGLFHPQTQVPVY